MKEDDLDAYRDRAVRPIEGQHQYRPALADDVCAYCARLPDDPVHIGVDLDT